MPPYCLRSSHAAVLPPFVPVGVAVLVAIQVAALLAAVAGGVPGERYHRAVDRAGLARG